MNEKEAKRMLGTEFEYHFSDKDSMKAYVKAYDPKVGLTCVSLGGVTKSGYKFPKDELDESGDVCLIGMDFKKAGLPGSQHTPELALKRLSAIKKTGKHVVQSQNYGNPSCSF